MKRQIELIRYGAHKSLIKSSSVLIVLLIILQFVNSTTIHEESDDVRRHNDANELTFCQQLRNFESRRARDYKDKGSRVHVRVPRCNRIGDFEPIQCSNEIDNTHCFCVDEYGIEIPGTRAETEDQVNCKKTEDDCPAASCRMFCPSGFARNQTSGCPICKCFDACSDVKCPNGHECEPIEVKCKNEPCPPIPTCRRARSLNDFCPAGSPLSIAGTIRPFLCGNDPGKPQCPPLYKCMVQTGNDYGVCCPASLQYEKPGTCPNSIDFISSPAHGVLCGSSCSHDLECPHVQKCCESAKCGKTCQQPKDSTLCHQAKLQSEILAISRNEGQGYTPQCDTKNGQFKTKQCSNNGLVCWCVNPENGNKIKGTIGAAKTVQCDNIENLLIRSGARSMDGNNQCDQNICAAVCQYGFKTDHNGCNTCECELPCEGFICPVGSKCVVAKDPKCTSGSGLCLSEPICQPDLIYSNPCDQGVPLTHNFTEEIAYCHEELNPSEYQVQTFLDASDENVVGRSLMSKITCPVGFKCTRLKGQSESVCCPNDLIPASADNHEVEETTTTVRQASMCEYLRDFSERMEGTEEGMALAINPPKCNTDGSFVAMQCQLKRMTVTKAEQKKVLEQNNIREMRKLLKNRRRRDVETLKLIRVDNVQQNRRSDDGLDTQVVLDFLKKRIIESPDRFITELFGDNTQGRTARVIDIQAEDYDDEEESDELDARDDRKLALKSQNRFNDLVEVEVEQCYCVDRFGTEIPQTRGSINVTEDTCRQIRDNIDCLDLTCRMGCDYGFVIDPNSKCPTCQCRDPCDGVQCDNNQECRTVEVSCEDAYCPPVPSCFPKKQGQCPFLVPPAGEDSDDACAYECRSDNHCSASKKCCSNGCGTVCVEPMLKSACQHLQSIQIHQAIELGIPAKQKYIAQCNDDGTWKTIQCGPNNICWCVDERGNEKSGTRTSDGIPNCSVSKTSNCPKVRCKYCEHGYVFDENGCKTCECKDLCKEIKCPMDEQCELVQVECINSSAINSTQPCPRLPICTPIRDSVCTEGLPLKQNGRDINCGPDATECPTTHTCNLNPITKHGVCCAKSRDVCFESIDSSCILNDNDVSESIVKYRFNPRYNKCTAIRLSKKNKNSSCASKNLFHNEQACKSVCPVLTQCERLKLKNSIVARRRADKSDIWFRPRCDPETGNWSSVQCIGENTTENTRVCWCADKKGSPIKGSLTKGAEPVCNYRQARRRVQEHTDPVMEELIRQITYLTDESNFLDDDDENSSLEGRSLPSDDKIAIATERALEISEKLSESTKKLIASTTRCDSLRSTARFTVTCDEQGNFQPMQCNHETCWCVDEAGNQLPFSNTFRKGSKNCKHTPLDAIEIELNLINPNNVKLTNLYDIMYEDVRQLIGDENFVNFRVHENSDGTVMLKFDLIDDEKVNQAFAIEEMSKEDNLFLFHGMLKVDMRQSKFSHRIPMEVLTNAQRSSLGIPQNTFHTIVFIIATSSAFIVSILVIYVMLKKGRTKDDKTHYVNNKNLHSGDKFIDYTSPIFVLSANDLPRSHHHPQHHHNSRNNDES